jgi:hypothetical protein
MRHNLITGWLKVLFVFPLFLLAAPLLSMQSSWAQPSSQSGNSDHRSAETVAPVLSYSSIFGQYHGYKDEKVTSWPEANTTVGRIGGWRFYAEEASQPDQSDQKMVIPAQPPASLLFEQSGKHSGQESKP